MKPKPSLPTFMILCASLLILASPVMAQSDRASQSVTKSNSPAGSVCNENTKNFTFGAGANFFRFCLSDEGTIGRFFSPAGASSHLSFYEGYVACGTGAANAHSAGGSQVSDSGWGPESTSQPGGPNTLPITITRNSLDGKFQLAQTFEWNTAEKEVLITMALKNISGATITNVRLSRYYNSHVSDGFFDDIHDRDSDSTWATDPGAGAGHHTVMLTALTFALTHTAFIEKFDDWNPGGGGAQTATKCTAIAQPVPTAPDNYVGRITYVLGTLAANASKTVQVVYRRL